MARISKRNIIPLKEMDSIDAIRFREKINELTKAAMNDEVATLVLITPKRSVLDAYERLVTHKTIQLTS